jgi:hypothetical protein
MNGATASQPCPLPNVTGVARPGMNRPMTMK